jgi:large subunit ribosomal protein L29e
VKFNLEYKSKVLIIVENILISYINFIPYLLTMAKDKNHSSKNQNHKNHRNGIKKPIRQRFATLKGVNQKFLRNRRRCVRNDPNIKHNRAVEKQVAAFKAREQ